MPGVLLARDTMVVVVSPPYTTHAPEKPAQAALFDAVVVARMVVVRVTKPTLDPDRYVVVIVVLSGGGGGGVGKYLNLAGAGGGAPKRPAPAAADEDAKKKRKRPKEEDEVVYGLRPGVKVDEDDE